MARMQTTRHHAPHSVHGSKQERRGDLRCESIPSHFLKLLCSGSRRTDRKADDGQEKNEEKGNVCCNYGSLWSNSLQRSVWRQSGRRGRRDGDANAFTETDFIQTFRATSKPSCLFLVVTHSHNQHRSTVM